MAGRTFLSGMFSDQIKCDLVMVKVRAERFLAIVAVHTVRAEGQEMFGGEGLVDLQVTVAAGVLIEWRSVSLSVTILTGKGRAVRLLLVRGQLERDRIVIKRSRAPTRRAVTGSALITQRTAMRIILGMAGGAVLRRALEDSVDVALLAVNGCMFPVKMEGELRMINGRGLPAAR